ncbi:hypothetical protein [Ulvibacter litoralis]|nr:hypothetical protein [Ulvibacter litoralis]
MVVSGTTAYDYTSTFEYNDENFPTKEFKLDSSGTTTINFTYN